MKIGIISLGCPKNLVDSETMLGILKDREIYITNEPSEADIIIINTCGFIESAKQEAIETIFNMIEYKTKGNCKYLIVTGCLGQRYAKDLLKDVPEIDCILGTDYYGKIMEAIDALQTGKRFEWTVPNEKINPIHTKNPRDITTAPYTAYLKIAEGCDNKCTYCIIPKLRGKYISKDFNLILEEARNLVDNGVKEIILVAQDTTRYGEDLYGKLRLAELLVELNKIEKLKWIRVLYCYPQYFTDELIDAFATCEKVCKYIDIPLQHASNRILKKMNRIDRVESIEVLLDKLRTKIADICIRTTFIVGFPGETQEDFESLKHFIEKQCFDNVGIFTYSQEEDTPAAIMPNQVEEQIKEERYHELMSLQAQLSEHKNQLLEGKSLEVVIESKNINENEIIVTARSYREAPEIDGTIFVENAENLEIGDFVKVEVSQGFTYEMVANYEEK